MSSFGELKSLHAIEGQAAIENHLDRESIEVDVPRLDERALGSDESSSEDAKQIGFEELENHDAHLGVAAVAEPRDQTQPVFVVQFFADNALDHIEKFSGDQTLEFSEGLLLENPGDLLALFRIAFAQRQAAKVLEQARADRRFFALAVPGAATRPSAKARRLGA